MVFKVLFGNIIFAHYAIADRHTCYVHRLRIAGDQRMPPGQILVGRPQAVGAGGRKPVEAADAAGLQHNAVGDPDLAIGVVATPACPGIQEPARDVREIDLIGVLVPKLHQAAFAATVAQRLPLLRGQLAKRPLPKRPIGHPSGTRWDEGA